MAMKFGERMSYYTSQFPWMYLSTHALISVCNIVNKSLSPTDFGNRRTFLIGRLQAIISTSTDW